MDLAAAYQFNLPRSVSVDLFRRIENAVETLPDVDFALDDFVSSYNFTQYTSQVKLMAALIALIDAEHTIHAFLYEGFAEESTLLALYGRQLVENHRQLRDDAATLGFLKLGAEKLLEEDLTVPVIGGLGEDSSIRRGSSGISEVASDS